jgi:nitrilase
MTSATERMRVAAVQTVSGGDVEANLASAEPLVAAAAAEGARLVVLPEYFGIFGLRATDKVSVREADGDGPQQAFLSRLARQQGIWLVGGTVPIASADPGRVRSALVVYAPDGKRIARYDKIHLFAFTRGDERYDEGKTIEPGRDVVTIELPCGRVGLSICYDVRFPELYRRMGPLSLILVPSAFTATTGAAHWHLLLRTRAVGEPVLRPRRRHRAASIRADAAPTVHSMLIDPWGRVVAELDQGPGFIVGEIDPDAARERPGRVACALAPGAVARLS